MKNTRISDIYVLCFGCRCSSGFSCCCCCCVYFTLGPARSKNQPRLVLWTHCERWTKCTASVAYRKLNWNSTEAAVPSTGKGNSTATQSKQSKVRRSDVSERERQATAAAAAAAAESNRGRHTHTHARTGRAEYVRTNERTNERTSEQRDHQIIHTAQRAVSSAAKVSVDESQTGRQPTNDSSDSDASFVDGSGRGSRDCAVCVRAVRAENSGGKLLAYSCRRLLCLVRVYDQKIICVSAVAETVVGQQIERPAIWNYVQRACTVQSLNIGRALEVGVVNKLAEMRG